MTLDRAKADMPHAKLRVCYFGAYRANYSRNKIMINGLRQNGVSVIECHESLWHGIEDRVAMVSGGWRHPSFWWRVVKTYGRLLRRYWRLQGQFDLLVVGYPGQFDVFLARLLSWQSGKPLVWDVLMSIYQVAFERGLHQRSLLMVYLIRRVERLACRLPDLLVLETDQYAAWFQDVHGVCANRIRLVPLGADTALFQPVGERPARADNDFRVLYYGSFLPSHGVDIIVEAARLLKKESSIRITFAGVGPEREAAKECAARYGLENVEFAGWLEQDALAQLIADADICLGVFGETPQSMMTVQNRIYESLAMAKPLLTGESAAVRENFRHAIDLFLCARADPDALALSILLLRSQPQLRAQMAANGFRRVQDEFSLRPIGECFLHVLTDTF